MSKEATNAAEVARLVQVPVLLIDEPPAPIRATMDARKLEELAQSLRAVGMIEPIVVEARDGRYRIVAGHRRYLAARMAGLVEVPAIVMTTTSAAVEAVMLHENIHREDLNPAEQARWFGRLLETLCGGDTDRLADLVHESRGYVESRLLLLRGDPLVFEELEQGTISLGVATELNKYTDDVLRKMRLENAVAGGATARLVREWREKDKLIEDSVAAARARGEVSAETGPVALADPMTCWFCNTNEDKATMELVPLHRLCGKIVRARCASEGA